MSVSFLRRAKTWLATLAASLLIIGAPASVMAAYGGDTYGKCAYGQSCPVVPAPSNPPPAGETVETTTPPTTPPTTITADIDHDGNQEQATDTNNNTADGYEQYTDPDGSSTVIVTTDGEHSGGSSFLLDTNGDGIPDVYWSPADAYDAPVVEQVLGDNTVWAYQNSKNQTQYYYPKQKNPTSSPGATTTVTPPASGEHRITNNNFGGAAYEKIGEIAQKIPTPVAYSFPYLLLALIVLLIVRLLWQAKREVTRMRLAAANIEREKGLVLEKQNFLMLASHYLRTPLTALKGNIELMQSLKQIDDVTAANLQNAAGGIQNEANALLAKLDTNQGLEQIAVSPNTQVSLRKAFFSPLIIGPLVGIVLLLIFVNFIFADFRVTSPNIIDFLVQLAVAGILAQWLVSTLRRRQINRQNRLDQQRLLDQQRELDTARSTFISDANSGLSMQIDAFTSQLAQVTARGVDTARIGRAIAQLRDISNKFMLATQLQTTALQTSKSPFNSAFVVQTSIANNQKKADDKKILLEAQAQGGQIAQNQSLLTTVLDSMVDNAIKFSDEKGSVKIEQHTNAGVVQYSVTDQGAGMTNEQLTTLFKPFSRAESAETFNTEGLGFSLYLDRLIMHYLGGDINLTSQPGKGTRVEMSLSTSS